MSALDSLKLSGGQRAALEAATANYERNVAALGFYLEPRGITFDAAVTQRLGLVSDPEPGHERMEGWLSLPYLTATGVVAMKFRCVTHEDCKEAGCQRYDAPAGQKAKLYNAQVLTQPGRMAAVVEGEFKAIVVTHNLEIPAVGTSAGQWLEHWPRTLADYDKVFVFADNDDAGVKHAKDKVLKSLPNGQLVVPPSEHPKVDDWIQAVGADEVREAMGL